MNIFVYRAGNIIIRGMLNICGFSFISAMTREYYALLKANFIGLSLQKTVYLSPAL